MNNLKISTHKQGVAIESDNTKFLLSFETTHLQYNKAKAFAEGKRGNLPTALQAEIIRNNLTQINEAFTGAGKPMLCKSWMDGNDPHRGTSHARTINFGSGFVTTYTKASSNPVCVILPFPEKAK